MADLPFYEKINRLRSALKLHADLGRLQTEKFLVEEGNYVGHQFCFADGNGLWRFDSQYFELFSEGSCRRLPIQPLFQADAAVTLTMPSGGLPLVDNRDTNNPSKAA